MSSEPDDVEKVAIECYEQWMKGINWPLKAWLQLKRVMVQRTPERESHRGSSFLKN
jgi:hypothetical protein